MSIKKTIKKILREHVLIVTCPSCSFKFNWLSVPESGMGYVKCPKCGKPVTQNDAYDDFAENNVKEFPYGDMTIIISSGGASIVGDGWDLSMPSEKFDSLIKKYGMNYEKLRDEMIKCYKDFFED